jgi:hypothetical protein
LISPINIPKIPDDYNTNPTNADSDSDDLDDRVELVLRTSPTSADTDNDGISDKNEDLDNDCITNKAELIAKTNPLRKDSDNDGVDDKAETDYNTDPKNGIQTTMVYQMVGK